MKLAGKVGLITGGTRGIGAATAVELARGGVDAALVTNDYITGENFVIDGGQTMRIA